MKSLSNLLSIYKSSHLNHKNIATHVVGIPLILWSAGLFFATFPITLWSLQSNLMQGLAVLIFIYYLALDLKLGVIAIALIAPIWWHANSYASADHAYTIAAVVFLIGWVFQFVGHFYEKAKPAFFDDLKQLLIGPLFLVAELCFALKLFPTLSQQVTAQALLLRQQLDTKKAS